MTRNIVTRGTTIEIALGVYSDFDVIGIAVATCDFDINEMYREFVTYREWKFDRWTVPVFEFRDWLIGVAKVLELVGSERWNIEVGFKEYLDTQQDNGATERST